MSASQIIQCLQQQLNPDVLEWKKQQTIPQQRGIAVPPVTCSLQKQATGCIWPLGISWLHPDIYWHIINYLSSIGSTLDIDINLNKVANENDLTNTVNLGAHQEPQDCFTCPFLLTSSANMLAKGIFEVLLQLAGLRVYQRAEKRWLREAGSVGSILCYPSSCPQCLPLSNQS